MTYSNSATIATHYLHDSYHQPCGNGTEKCIIDSLVTYLDSILISTLIEYVVLQPSVLVSYTYTYTYCIYIYIYTHMLHMYTSRLHVLTVYMTGISQALLKIRRFLPSCACPRWWHVGSDVTASRKEQQGSAGSNFRKSHGIVVSKDVIPWKASWFQKESDDWQLEWSW